MAATAVIAAIAIGTTAYSVNEGKKARAEQADVAQKQANDQAALQKKQKDKEMQLQQQAFSTAASARASNAAQASANPATSSPIGNVNQVASGGGKTLIGM